MGGDRKGFGRFSGIGVKWRAGGVQEKGTHIFLNKQYCTTMFFLPTLFIHCLIRESVCCGAAGSI